MKLREASLFALVGVGIYTLYYLLPVLGVVIEVQELVDINPAMSVYVKQFGYIRVLMLPVCVYIPLMAFFYTLHQR